MPVQIKELSVNADGSDRFLDAYLAVTTEKGKLKGESRSPRHQGASQVVGWSWGATASSAVGSGKATGRRSYRNLIVSKRIDSASLGLLTTLTRNGVVKEAVLTVCKWGSNPYDYFIVKIQAARVVDLQVTMGDDGKPVEVVTFAFNKVEVSYQAQMDDGSLGGTQTFNDEILPV